MTTTTKSTSYAITREPKYTTKTAIENYLMTSIAGSFDSQINDWIYSIEAYIEGITGRKFLADDTATRRSFNSEGEYDVLIDDCVEVTKVETGTDTDDLNEVESDEYYVGPENAVECHKPINVLEMISGVFPHARRSVHVTARWGYSDIVPDDIRLAATILVAGIINYSNKADGEIKTMTVGRYSVTYKDDKGWEDAENVRRILERYKAL